MGILIFVLQELLVLLVVGVAVCDSRAATVMAAAEEGTFAALITKEASANNSKNDSAQANGGNASSSLGLDDGCIGIEEDDEELFHGRPQSRMFQMG